MKNTSCDKKKRTLRLGLTYIDILLNLKNVSGGFLNFTS
jgi:hypothetical protein